MIAHEHLHLVNIRQVLFVTLVALCTAGVMYLGHWLFSQTTAFVLNIAVLVAAAAFVMLLIQKSGTFLLFYAVIGVLTVGMADVGVTGIQKILVYLIAALVYEVVFLFLKVHVHFLPVDVVLGAAISAMIIPFFAALLIAGFVIPLQVVNLMLLAFVAAFCGSIVVCVIWHYVKNIVLFVELDMYLKGIV